ncbi:YceK/YidQ family lipoprotein [Photorhabdus laumondii]|uniref:YceK/YidQ family lipoprotein n=1 Tax=Photorhabdus laumondii TaxID=2218628 RepID=UPI0025B0BFE9|nr:YceK/YidQ family lipoprotein [Photorhabdus laumondii]
MKSNKLILFCVTLGWLLISGCTSIMIHSGPSRGYYPGAKTDIEMLRDQDTGWVMKPLLAIDLPFSALLDTLLLPYDYIKSDEDQSASSPKERIEKIEKAQHQTKNN